VPAKWALTSVDQLAPDMTANAIPIQTMNGNAINASAANLNASLPWTFFGVL
jgi:hypothetical protein